MKIGFLLGGFTGIGGIGRATSILANELCQEKNKEVYTISFFNNKKLNHYNLDKRIHQSFLFDKEINMTKGILKGGVLKLRKYLLDNDIDIIIACGALYYPITVLSVTGIKTKSICWEHSNALNDKDHSFQMLCRRFGAKYADYVVTLTKQDQKNYIEKYGIENIKQIYNPLDISDNTKNTRGYNTNSKRIISVGRLSYPKNFELLIDVANEVFKTNEDWTWDIFGEGETRSNIEKKIEKYGLESRVKLKGSVDNIYEQYSNYAFLVMTSRSEGFPMVLLEGLANGLPLVSFDIQTGPNEIISDGVNGYLVEPLNIEEMASKIKLLIEQKNIRNEMSNASRVCTKPFQKKLILQNWNELFVSILN